MKKYWKTKIQPLFPLLDPTQNLVPVSYEILRTPLSHLNVCVQFPVLSTLWPPSGALPPPPLQYEGQDLSIHKYMSTFRRKETSESRQYVERHSV